MSDKLKSALARASSIIRAMPPGHSSLGVAGIAEWHRRWMAIFHEHIQPTASPGRGKKKDLPLDMQIVFNESALAALGLPNDLERHINAALQARDPEVFKTIASAIDSVNNAPERHTKISRHCYYVSRAADELQRELQFPPGRRQIRARALAAMKSAGHDCWNPQDDRQRWNEVWKITGIPGRVAGA